MSIRLAGIAISTLQAMLTARILGAEGYGVVAFVLSLSSIFAVLVLLGTEPLAAREVARLLTLKDRSGVIGFLRTIRLAVVVTSAVGALLWLLGSYRLELVVTGTGGLAIFVAFVFPLMAMTLQMQGILRGFGRVASSQLPVMVIRPATVVTFLSAAWLLSWPVQPAQYMVAAVVGSAFAFLLAAFVLRRTLSAFRDIRATPTQLEPVARAAGPFLAVSVLGIVIGEINTLLLAVLADSKETGLFQPIARIAPLLLLALQAVSVRYGPRISELWTAGERERLAAVTRLVTLSTTLFTLLAAIVLLMFSKPLLGLFGPEFVAIAPALWWIAGAQVFNVACGPVGLLLSMSGHARQTILPQLFGIVVNVVVGVWLIPLQGAEGAAIAFASGTVAWNVLLLVVVKKHMGEDPSLWGILQAKLSAPAKN